MMIVRSTSVAETEALGESLGRSLPHGTVLGLSGGPGTGKTAFTRGFARGLGCAGRVHSSPSALLDEYGGGRLRLFHLDLRSLRSPDEVRAAGLVEYLTDPDGVSIVEWIERWCGDAKSEEGGRLRRVYLHASGETTREIAYDC